MVKSLLLEPTKDLTTENPEGIEEIPPPERTIGPCVGPFDSYPGTGIPLPEIFRYPAALLAV
jgi:hypothetical protein